MQPQTSDAFAALVGLDWADAQPDGCLPAAGTAQREFLSLEPSPEALNTWGQTLHTRFHGPPVAGCLARTQGPLVSARRTYDVLVLFPVQPRTGATYRAAFPPRRANDAPTDAALQGELLRKHRAKLTPRRPHSPTRRAWAPLVAHRRRLGGDNVRLTNRLPRALTNSLPQVRHWFPATDTALFGDCLSRWPTPNAAPLARRTTLAGFCRAHHGRAADVMTTRIAAIQSTRARTPDAGVIAPNVRRVPARVAHLRVPFQASAAVDTASAQRAQDPPAFPLFDALPGAGAVLAPRLLVAFGAQRERLPSADARQKEAGIAPVTARSGKQAWGHWRLQWPKLLRQTFVAWAAESPRHAFWAQVYSQQQRAKGKAHQAAVRALACTWLRILYRCGQERTPYDASVYLQALNRRSAPLLHTLAHEAYKGVKTP